jgi:hypothetical protein
MDSGKVAFSARNAERVLREVPIQGLFHTAWAHRDRCKYSDFAAAFGALRKRSDESSVPTAPLLTPTRDLDRIEIPQRSTPLYAIPYSKAREALAVKRRDFIALLGGAAVVGRWLAQE